MPLTAWTNGEAVVLLDDEGGRYSMTPAEARALARSIKVAADGLDRWASGEASPTGAPMQQEVPDDEG